MAVGSGFDTIEGAKSFITNFVLSGLPDPTGDAVALVSESPEIIKAELRGWLRKKMTDAATNEDYESLDRYQAYYTCLNGDCNKLQELQAGQVIFEDNFDKENNGKGILNYTELTNWILTYGKIDLIGNGFWDAYPGNGLYIDLDGTYGKKRSEAKAGTIKTKSKLLLKPGMYRLSFDLYKNPYQWPNTVIVRIGDIEKKITKDEKDLDRTKENIDFDVDAPRSVEIEFDHMGGDWDGLFLDNVKLTKLR